MIEQDTIKLLRECDAGIKMGIASIRDVQDDVKNPELRERLTKSRSENEKLQEELQALLDEYHDDGKDPNAIAKGMAWMKTGVMMTVDRSDATIADLITDGCNMGVKSLNRYLNQYPAADERSKDITKRLIGAEESLAADIRRFL